MTVVVRVGPPTRPMSQAEAEDWAEIHLPQPTPKVGLCVGVLPSGEVLGPFRTPREAEAALDARLGPLSHGASAGSVRFVDPAHHAPQTEGTLNG